MKGTSEINFSNASSSPNESCVFEPATTEEMNVRLAMPVILTIMALTDNLLVIFLVFSTKKLRKNTNFFIVNMAVSDMITSIVHCFVFGISHLHESYGIVVLSDTICKLMNYFMRMAPMVSLLTLLVIGIDRYRAVSSPSRVTTISRPFFSFLVLLTWVIPGVLFIYTAVILKRIPGSAVCQKLQLHLNAREYTVFVTSFTALIFVCLTVINIQILRKLRQKTAKSPDLNAIEKQKRNRKVRSAVMMVLCSLLLYFLCTSPLHLFSPFGREFVLRYKKFYCINVEVPFAVFYNLLIAHSALSPLVYFIFLRDFREAFKKRFLPRTVCVGHPPKQEY